MTKGAVPAGLPSPRFTLLVLFLALPAAASSEPAELAFAVDYSAPEGCPTRSEFEQAVFSRAERARSVERDGATLVFEVELIAGAPGFAGVLRLTLPDGTRSRRDVAGESCSETVTALAVIAALSLEGYRESARDGGDPNPAEASSEAGSTRKSPVSETPVDSSRGRSEGDRVAPRERSAWSGAMPGIFAGGVWESAVAPSAPLGVFAGAGLELHGSGILRPSMRVGLLYTLTATERVEPNRAEFRLLAARLALCPVALAGGGSPSVRACLELDAGALEAAGSGPDVVRPRPRGMAWLGFGPALRGVLPLGRAFSFEATVAGRALAHHDRFVFRPGTLVHDVPPISVGLGLGVAAWWP